MDCKNCNFKKITEVYLKNRASVAKELLESMGDKRTFGAAYLEGRLDAINELLEKLEKLKKEDLCQG